nr:arogenate dehydrogenase 2, chloroplastic-like [Quercus suber]POF05705.1 arogenate dehydrogenase 2, chloroplastic [Quercus suber]
MLSLSSLHHHSSPPQPNDSSLSSSLSLSSSASLKPTTTAATATTPKTLYLRRKPLRIRALDAAQPYDYETKLAITHFHNTHHLKIGIIGFGNYGQFLAKTLVSQGHTVLAHSRSDHSRVAKSLGVSFFFDPNDLCEEHPEVILLCTSIISTERVLASLPLQRLKRSTLFVDVLSVKEFPKNLLLDLLPPYFDVICCHPMFGPQSAKQTWDGLFFVYEKARITNEDSRISRCDKFLNVFFYG